MHKVRSPYLQGRGAQINPPNKFDHLQRGSEIPWSDDEGVSNLRSTEYIPNYPKSIVNTVDSPDIGHGYSLNPYQGCEHGCIYCYARNTHTYWGYSAGIDFEQKILVKQNAAELLENKLKSKAWKPTPIMLSGNTDCYQPAEKKLKITRSILKVLCTYNHPVGIITKNSLILRDTDLLKSMASKGLVHVAISITSLKEQLIRKLEPRTSSGKNRLKTIHELSRIGIPVSVMMAPIIPSINDTEIYDVAESTSQAGALSLNYTIVRLNGDVSQIFQDWLSKTFPAKAERVLKQIRHIHGGKLSDSRFGIRMRGEGNIAKIIHQQVQLAREKFFEGRKMPEYNLDHFDPKSGSGQLKLF